MHNLTTDVVVASPDSDVATIRELDLGISMISETTVRAPFCATARAPFCSLKPNASTAKVILHV